MIQKEDVELFQQLLEQYRFDFCKLVYIIFPFGEPGHPLEDYAPYDWQIEQWAKLSKHLSNPETRFETYRLIISSGNGAAKTAFGAMTYLMLMYTQQLRARITANTQPQLNSVVWPEYDVWFRHARFHDVFFDKFGTSIKAKDAELADTWRLDAVTWSEQSPASISGLHNKGKAIMYIFEEAPGIPAVIWQYASGAFTETETIKLFLAFGNSDDPESKFEQNMNSPLWHSLRIDTRSLKHIDPKQIADWLSESLGNEDADDFRVRVRGLPRKTSKDSIINIENVNAAIERGKTFDVKSVSILPVVLTCDPAWRGGDETVIAYQQGNYRCLLERFKLEKEANETHFLTYQKLCKWEQELGADLVLIDQGEGTAIFSFAMNAGKSHWMLVSFAAEANDAEDFKDRQYQNIRAQMYYETNKWLMNGGILDAKNPDDLDVIRKQLCWTKGGRHKISQKKIAEPKVDIKSRVGSSPDVADALVLPSSYQVLERLPENSRGMEDRFLTGTTPFTMPAHPDPYQDDVIDADYRDIYGS